MTTIKLHGFLEEDLQDYRKASMFLAFPKCSFKCARELNKDPKEICQNYFNIDSKIIEYNLEDLWKYYQNNIITESFVLGGLEPLDTFNDVVKFIDFIRKNKKCNDDIVIYTGYYKDEINDKIETLKKYNNIIMKFGRYIPNNERHYDEVLGVRLISDDQYGEKIC